MYQPGPVLAIPPMVSIFTRGIGWADGSGMIMDPASGTYESANRAVYYPINLPASCVVRRVWWANGATVSGGATIECGIYADSGSRSPGAKITSGSATQGNANQVQFVDVTDVTIPAGLYWIAISSSSATSTTLFRSIEAYIQLTTRFEEASASPLPATATPVQSTVQYYWLCGFATTATP